MPEIATAEQVVPPTYRMLLERSGVQRIMLIQLLGPMAREMWSVALVLLVLHQFDSPALAGLAVLLNQVGLLVVPFAGVVLDRYGEKRIVAIDFVVSTTVLGMVASLSLGDVLTIPALLPLLLFGSVTTQIGSLGLRTALTTDMPDELLERANAVMFTTRASSRFAGPVVAGCISTLVNPEAAIFLAATLFAVAVWIVTGYEERRTLTVQMPPVWDDTRDSLRYLIDNTMIRRVTGFIVVAFVGWGAFYSAMPAMVDRDLHASGMLVGAAYAAFALSDVIFGVLSGRLDTRGREWMLLAGATFVAGCGLIVMSTGSVAALLIGAALVGACETPVDQTSYVIRQRYSRPALVGRMMAIAIAIDCAACSLGMAMAGAIAEHSPSLALMVSGAIVICASVIPVFRIRGLDMTPELVDLRDRCSVPSSPSR